MVSDMRLLSARAEKSRQPPPACWRAASRSPCRARSTRTPPAPWPSAASMPDQCALAWQRARAGGEQSCPRKHSRAACTAQADWMSQARKRSVALEQSALSTHARRRKGADDYAQAGAEHRRAELASLARQREHWAISPWAAAAYSLVEHATKTPTAQPRWTTCSIDGAPSISTKHVYDSGST